MRKNEMKLYIPLLALLVLAVCAYLFFSVRTRDTQAPVICVATDTLSISVNDPESALLQGVSATDDKEGDVTSSIVVEKISDLAEDHTATVTYAAFDSSGNISRATRTICYTDYTPPVFALSSPLVFNVGLSVDVLSRVTVTDVLDGDISRNLKATLVSDSASLSTAGVHEVTFRVTNSMGDTARITLPVDVLPAATYSGTINLTQNLVYVSQGNSFRPSWYFESLTLGLTDYTLADGVELEYESNVDTSVPGVYSVTYTARHGLSKSFTRLIVVVK